MPSASGNGGPDQGSGKNPGKSSATGKGRIFLWISMLVFLIFAANVVIGKIAISQGATSVPGLSDVGEFLTLFVSVVFFIAACLQSERAARDE